MAVQQRRPRRPVHGVLLLDKPRGLSSNHALQRVKHLFQAEKAGHTGTLDPMATGLLPIALGEATKFSAMLLEADKGYEAEVLLGVDTDSGDADGVVLRERPVQVELPMLEAALARLRGPILQLPPMYSALKRDGRPLYEYAREGIEVERKARQVVIHALELLSVDLPRLRIRVRCSKGTYIRTLAMDLGELLGCGAHLSALRRIAIGAFELSAACTLEALEALPLEGRDALLMPVDTLVGGYPVLQLGAEDAAHLLQGRRIRLDPPGAEGPVRVFGPTGFLGVAQRENAGNLLVPQRLVATGNA